MHKDPLTEWENGFPYDLLAAAGVTPESSLREVREASFLLMDRDGMTAAARRAWDDLRHPARRLAMDFFLLDDDLEEEGE